MQLSEIAYFPTISFLSSIKNVNNLQILGHSEYQKKKHSNRCFILSSQGLLHLNIPLEKGRNQSTFFKNVKISKEYSWQKNHWKALESCYNNSPWFNFYKDDLYQLY